MGSFVWSRVSARDLQRDEREKATCVNRAGGFLGVAKRIGHLTNAKIPQMPVASEGFFVCMRQLNDIAEMDKMW